MFLLPSIVGTVFEKRNENYFYRYCRHYFRSAAFIDIRCWLRSGSTVLRTKQRWFRFPNGCDCGHNGDESVLYQTRRIQLSFWHAFPFREVECDCLRSGTTTGVISFLFSFSFPFFLLRLPLSPSLKQTPDEIETARGYDMEQTDNSVRYLDSG